MVVRADIVAANKYLALHFSQFLCRVDGSEKIGTAKKWNWKFFLTKNCPSFLPKRAFLPPNAHYSTKKYNNSLGRD